jgi:hypothetical protein
VIEACAYRKQTAAISQDLVSRALDHLYPQHI